MIIAIDGPAGSGKSSTAKAVAKSLGYLHLDSGAMYRAVTLDVLEKGIDPSSEKVVQICQNASIQLVEKNGSLAVFLNDRDVSEAIRTPQVTRAIAPVAANPAVRKILVDKQREMGKNGGIVADGRDIGTVVFPNADLKIFMDASIEARAKRRQDELKQSGVSVAIDELIDDIKQRDKTDTERSASPLLKAKDAIVIDTSELEFDEQVNIILEKVKEQRHEHNN